MIGASGFDSGLAFTNGQPDPGSSVKRVGSGVWKAYSGSVSLDLAGDGPGEAYEPEALVAAGSTYTLSFEMGGDFTCGPVVKSLKVGGDTSESFSFDTSHSSPARMGWAHHELTFFVATGNHTNNIDFVDTSQPPSSCGAVIDDVQLFKD